MGGRLARYDNDVNAKNAGWNAGTLARWEVNDSTQAIAFWGREEGNCCRQQPLVFTTGAHLPPPVPRRYFWGQHWTREVYLNENFGALFRTTAVDDWTVRAGLFRSIGTNDHNFGDFFTNVAPTGVGDHTIVAQPRQSFGSYYGEVRATRVITDGSFRHTVNFAVRGRDVERYFGGSDSRTFGQGTVGVRMPVVEPV